jgi:flagellar protein FlaG
MSPQARCGQWRSKEEKRAMSFDITPVSAAGTPAAVHSTHTAAAPTRATASESVTVDTIPATPPPEVHDAMGVAAQAYERLASQDRQLRFMIDEKTGHFEVQVHDLDGNLLFTVPPSKALDVASGGALE